MLKSSDLRRGRHVVFNLNAHWVFVPKSRRDPITARVFAVLRGAWETVCRDFECEIIEASYEPDHVHLLVSYPPKVHLAGLVNSLKGVSARRIKVARFPEVQRVMWGARFWSPSYCAVSCGGTPLDVVRRYIEQQRGERSSEGAAPPRPSGRGPCRRTPERSN
jgi:putative transposase